MVAREGSGHEVSKSVQKGSSRAQSRWQYKVPQGSRRGQTSKNSPARGWGVRAHSFRAHHRLSFNTCVSHPGTPKDNPESGLGPEVGMVMQDLNTRLGTCSNAMGFILQPHPEEKRAVCGHCRNSGGL